MLKFIIDLIPKKTSIEVYEWSETDVRTKRLNNSPQIESLTKKRQSLTFNQLQLAHAVIKADYLDRRSPIKLSIAFLFQSSDVIDVKRKNIQLMPGVSHVLNDFSMTSFSGRVAQGLAILFGQSLGFHFASHLLSHVETLPSSTLGGISKKSAMADFLFTNDSKRVLIESKGSFTQQHDAPSKIKKVLKDALEKQIDPWMKVLSPLPQNGYVVYSCLREPNDGPSAIYFVDPPDGDNSKTEIPLSADQVKRDNYAAWLQAMGLGEAAEKLALLNYDRVSPDTWLFYTQNIGGRVYAFPAQPHRYVYPHLGIDFEVLTSISSVINPPDNERRELAINLPEITPNNLEGISIFPDGTILASDYNLDRIVKIEL